MHNIITICDNHKLFEYYCYNVRIKLTLGWMVEWMNKLFFCNLIWANLYQTNNFILFPFSTVPEIRLGLGSMENTVWSVRNGRTFSNFNVWRPVKNKWLDAMVCYMIYYEGYHQVYWKFINLVAMVTYLHENPRKVKCNNGRDRNFGVDFLFLFFDFFPKSLDLPNIFNYRC